MQPIKVNLASFDYFDKRPVYLMMIVSIIVVLIISAYNFHLYNLGQRDIYTYKEKIAKSEIEWKKQQDRQNKNNIKISEEEKKILRSHADFVNRLIATDIFPWNQLLSMIERKVPNGLVLTEIVPSDNYRKLVLAGLASSTRKITFFMKRLKGWKVIQETVLLNLNLRKKDLSINAEGKKQDIEFRIESTLRVDRLFAETGYGNMGKTFINSAEKSFL